MHNYLLTAAGVEDHAAKLNPELLKRWQTALAQAKKNEASPLYPFAQVVAEPKRPPGEVLAPFLDAGSSPRTRMRAREVIVSYENPLRKCRPAR